MNNVNAYLKNCWLHFKKICVHKWWVFYYSLYFRIPIQGFFHDFSKFSPVEFFESVKFFSGIHSPIVEAKKIQGVSYAWLHHKGRNPHHYEYWTDNYDKNLGGVVGRKMPYKYVLELVCDYLAACRAYNEKGYFSFQKELDWWENCRDNKLMNEETKALVTLIFKHLVWYGLSFRKTRKQADSAAWSLGYSGPLFPEDEENGNAK